MKLTILGGRLHSPIDLFIAGQLPVSEETVQSNRKHATSLSLPTYRQERATVTKLAACGGGPSLAVNIDELKAWPGDIWAINGAWGFLQKHGIDATFISCDPHERVAEWCHGAKKALIDIHADPKVFETFRASGTDVATYDAGDGPGEIRVIGSTATAVPHLAKRRGYHEVTFFGCESCYFPGMTHAYQSEDREDELLIEVDGHDYLTAPDYYIQAHYLADYIRQVPDFLKEESGGLLRALIKTPARHIKWVSERYAQTFVARRPGEEKAA